MAVDIYLKLEDQKGPLPGESKDKDHTGWIEVHSYSWGINNQAYTMTGEGSGIGKCEVGHVNITKDFDSTTSTLKHHCATGEHFKKATFEFMKAGGKDRVCYKKLVLDDVFIAGVGEMSGGSDILSESVTMGFAKCTDAYTLQEKSGGKGAAKEFYYDVKTREHG